MTTNKQKTQIWGSRLNSSPDELNVEFCAGRDVKVLPMADQVLLKYDIWTNLAHAEMLCKTKIISDQELIDLTQTLLELSDKFESGEYTLDPAKEDVHINIEYYITQVKGIAAGNKIHSGRSRNDQIATDMRLYLRDELIALAKNLMPLIDNIISKADSEKDSIMPGFTHYQPAMITTAGHWLTSWSQALLRDAARFLKNLSEINSSPLGAAASFGTSWPIDREYTASLLGFDRVDENSLDCICSRGEYEASIASNLALMMNHLSTISQDLILLSTPYYHMLEIDDRFVTGSSIMPQKRNPDFAEIIRSKAAVCHGSLMSLLGILKGSMSAYNRDAQQTKYLIIDLFRECRTAPLILAEVCKTMRFNRDTMRQHCQSGFMNAADVADWMAQQHKLTFRECYEALSLAVKYSEEAGKLTFEALQRAFGETGLSVEFTQGDIDFLNSPTAMINLKKHTGGPAPESVSKMVDNQRRNRKSIYNQLLAFESRVEKARKNCFEMSS
jgi:argininosuccinate lyase